MSWVLSDHRTLPVTPSPTPSGGPRPGPHNPRPGRSGADELEDPVAPLHEVRQDHAAVQREFPEHRGVVAGVEDIVSA